MSKPKAAGEDQVFEGLSEPHFSQSKKSALGDVVNPVPMPIPIEQIDFYPYNPRTVRNRAYERIREAIRRRGYEGVLEVTRPPGSTHYQLSHGQNTRLEICKELFEEGDERFATMLCQIKPWRGDFAEHVSHLSENADRSDLTFLDSARGARVARDFLQRELGKKPSLRQQEKAFKEQGYSMDSGKLSRYDYTLDFLYQYIPATLEQGAGEPQIRALRRLHTALGKVAEENGSAVDRTRLDGAFGEAIAKHDGSDKWDYKKAEDAAIKAIAELIGLPKKHLKLAVAAHGTEKPGRRKVADGDDDQRSPAEGAGTPSTRDKADSPKVVTESPSSPSASPDSPPVMSPAEGAGSPSTPIETTDLPTLRQMAYTTARDLAGNLSLEALIHPLDQGIGFWVDLPPAPLADFTGEGGDFRAFYGADEGVETVSMWWFCAAISEQFSLWRQQLSKFIPSDSQLGALLLSEESLDLDAEIRNRVGQADIREFGEILIGGAEPTVHAQQIRLMQLSYQVHSTARAVGQPVWEE